MSHGTELIREIAALAERLDLVAYEQLPTVHGELTRIQGLVTVRLMTPPLAPAPIQPVQPYNGIEPTRLYTAKEAAALIGIKNEKTIYRMGSSKKLAVTRTGPKGGTTRFLGSDLIHFLASRRVA
jgi:hypothetical protein